MAKYLVIGLIGALLLGQGFGALVALTRIKQVVIQSPDPRLAQEVGQAIHLPPWANLVTSKLSLIARQAETCPRVKQADFERKFPNRLILVVEPREPRLAFEKNGRYLLVDGEGVCLSWTTCPDKALLRVEGMGVDAQVGERISGEWFERSCAVADAVAGAESLRPWTVDVSYPPELSVSAGSGARGIVGDSDDLARRVRVFVEALTEYGKQGKRVGLMELRTDPPIMWPEDPRPTQAPAGSH
jgi:hypothetical protein